MAQNKKHITPENVTEWLCSTGFLFPRNETELNRFEKIHGDVDYGLTGSELDPERIMKGLPYDKRTISFTPNVEKEDFTEFRMAARNGNALPKHIMDKIKKNQTKSKSDGTET